MGRYDDIINLPHHVSTKHPHMSIYDRAAQFAPFAALTGYGDAIDETARLTDRQYELDNDELANLELKLNQLQYMIDKKPRISVTYFEADERKAGGKYITVTGNLDRIDTLLGALMLINVPEEFTPHDHAADALDSIAVSDKGKLGISIHSILDITVD